MATIKVLLPDAMPAWVEGQTRSGRYPNASEYVRDLIRRDQDRADKIARLQHWSMRGWGVGARSATLCAVLQKVCDRSIYL